MELTLTLDEVVAVLRATGTMPTAVRELHGEGSAVLARVAVHELPGVSVAVRTATQLAGPVDLRVDDAGVVGRTWTLTIRASHPVLRFDMSGFVTDALRSALAAVPARLAMVRTQAGRTVVEIDLDVAAALLVGLVPGLAPGLQARIDDVRLGATVALRATVTG